MQENKVSVALSVLNQATAPLNQAARDFEIFQGRVEKALRFTAVAAAAWEVTASIREVFNHSLEMADSLQKASDQTGLTTRTLQELDFVAKESGTSIDAIKNGFNNVYKMATEAAKGNKAAAKTFEELNIKVTDSNGVLRSRNSLANDAIYALAGMSDKTLQSTKTIELFGRAGREMLPVISKGKDEIVKLREEANSLGLVLKDSTVKELDKAQDNLDLMKTRLSVTKAELVNNFTPAILATAGALNSWINTLSKGYDILTKIIVKGKSFKEVSEENQVEYLKSLDPSKSFNLIMQERDKYKSILDSKLSMVEENTKKLKTFQDKQDAAGAGGKYNFTYTVPIAGLKKANKELQEEINKTKKLYDIYQSGLNDLVNENTKTGDKPIENESKKSDTDKVNTLILESEKMLQESKAGIIQDGYTKEIRLLDDKYDQYKTKYSTEIEDTKKRAIALSNLTQWHKNAELEINVKYNDLICEDTGRYLQEQSELEKREAEKELAFQLKQKQEIIETERLIDNAKVDSIQDQSTKELAVLQMRYNEQRQLYEHNEVALTNLATSYAIERQNLQNAQNLKQIDGYTNMTGRITGIVNNWNTTLNNRAQNRIDQMKNEGKETDQAIQRYRQQAKTRQNILAAMSTVEALASAVKSIAQIWNDNTGHSWWGNMALSIVSGVEVLATSAANISAIKSQSFASGTKYAPYSGWSLTGEQGPEYQWVNKGDAIYNSHETKNIMNQNGGNLTINLKDNNGNVVSVLQKALRTGELDGFVKEFKQLALL